MKPFNVTDWFWAVAGDESKLWSSAKAGWVDPADLSYQQFASDEGQYSRIGTMAELLDIFRDQFPAGHVETYLPAKRYAVEVGGITVGGADVATDRESQAMIANAFAYLTASDAPSVSYKAASGFITLTAAQVKAIAIAVGAHVQNVFTKEAQCVAGIASGAITTREQVDAVFLAPALPPA